MNLLVNTEVTETAAESPHHFRIGQAKNKKVKD